MKMSVESKKTASLKVESVLRSILVFVLGTLSLCTFAQEAFYIYRNDGDFNGFFYDEVQEMRYSKVGVDTIEYDQWVTYEVVLADTTYRIPLAAIDSVSFIQPEIKLNPHLKFIGKDGYCPYILNCERVNESITRILFKKDIPAAMAPQMEDAFIALPSDEIAQTLYTEANGFDAKSFSCKVYYIEENTDGILVYGGSVKEIRDVFEQYITVEQIAIDDQNQIHRRIAGCTSDGLPYQIKTKEGSGEITVIDFNSTVSHSWNIASDSTQVDLSADLNLKLRVRAAYNITWTRLFVKITPDLLARVKPSIGLSVKREFKQKLSDLIPLPDGIPFPAAAPVFELCPMPTLFLNADGKLEARLNLPQVGLGVGMDIVIDSKNILFPIYGLVHLAEDEPEEPTPEMLDVSTEVKLSGTIYAGVEFQLAVNTNRWFDKILQAGIGMHFTAGPKVAAQISYSQSLIDDNEDSDQTYNVLANGSLTHTWLSLGFNAGAKGKVGWNDPSEVTFLDASKDICPSIMRLAPPFHSTTADTIGDNLQFEIHPEPCIPILYNNFKIGIFEKKYIQDEPKFITESGTWHKIVIREEDEFTYTLPMEGLRPVGHIACPVVEGPGGPFIVTSKGFFFVPPVKVELDQDEMHFNAVGEEKSITFTTNCLGDKFGFSGNGAQAYIASYRIDTIDRKNGKYKLTVITAPNNRLFSNCHFDKGDSMCPKLWFRDTNGQITSKNIKFDQDDNDLSKAYIHYFSATFGNYKVPIYGMPYAQFTRIGKDTIEVTAANNQYNFSMRIINTSTETDYITDKLQYVSSGSLVDHISQEKYTISFDNQPNNSQSRSYIILNGTLTTGLYDYERYNSSGELVEEVHYDMQKEGGTSRIDITYSFSE